MEIQNIVTKKKYIVTEEAWNSEAMDKKRKAFIVTNPNDTDITSQTVGNAANLKSAGLNNGEVKKEITNKQTIKKPK